MFMGLTPIVVHYADYHRAIELYTEAVAGYPSDSGQELAVCYANRAACHMKLVCNNYTV